MNSDQVSRKAAQLYAEYAAETPIGTLEPDYFAALYDGITSAPRLESKSFAEVKRNPAVRRISDPALATILMCCALCESLSVQEAMASERRLRILTMMVLGKENLEKETKRAMRALSKRREGPDLVAVETAIKRADDFWAAARAWAQSRRRAVGMRKPSDPRGAGRPARVYRELIPVLGQLLVQAGFNKKQASGHIARLFRSFGLADATDEGIEGTVRANLSS